MADPEVLAKQAKAQGLLNSIGTAWRQLADRLEARKAELVAQLIRSNDENTRGRIQQIDELLALPEALKLEAEPAMQQEDEVPL